MQLTDAQARFFYNQLEHIVPKMYEVLYPELPYRDLFPVSFAVPAGTQTIIRKDYDKVGKAQWIQNNASDLPRADVSAGETRYPVKECASSFGYTMSEIRAGALSGTSLAQERANAARKAIEEEMNDATFNGVSTINLPGLFTYQSASTIATDTVADNAGGTSKLWTNKTATEILYDVNALFSAVDVNSKQVEVPNKLALPPAQWNLISTTPYRDSSIKNFLVANCPWLNSEADIIKVRQLIDSTTISSADVDQMLVFDYNPEKLVIEIPMDITVHGPQLQGLEYVVPVTAEFASLHIMYPGSMRFGKGI